VESGGGGQEKSHPSPPPPPPPPDSYLGSPSLKMSELFRIANHPYLHNVLLHYGHRHNNEFFGPAQDLATGHFLFTGDHRNFGIESALSENTWRD
jgi:hypothetical protein